MASNRVNEVLDARTDPNRGPGYPVNTDDCGGGPMPGQGVGNNAHQDMHQQLKRADETIGAARGTGASTAKVGIIPEDEEKRQAWHKYQADRETVAHNDRAFKSGYECGRIDSQDPVHFLFQYHKATPEQLPKFDAINIACENLFRVIQSQCPAGEDKCSALKQVQIVRMMANMSIALNGKGISLLPGVMY